MTMTFEQFRTNAESWATERGIYEHSTALAQALKAVSELGELCDAVIKGDTAEQIDAVGDIAVCLVNVRAMTGSDFIKPSIEGRHCYSAQEQAAHLCSELGELLCCFYGCTMEYVENALSGCIQSLKLFCKSIGVDFEYCCQCAWHEIKDRKGRMVAGGAFVKE